LIGNAIKYTNSGNVSVQVEVYEETTRHYYMKLTIKDTGIGMPAEKLEYIFERFAKIDRSCSSANTGMGLGLAIVKEFIQDIEGEIYVESKEGQGSIFTCIIPYLKPLDKYHLTRLNREEDIHGKDTQNLINRG
jgi:signal transduction histidine kinase